MIKFFFKSILVLVAIVCAVSVYGMYSARSLPSWFDPNAADTDYASKTVRDELGRGGAAMLAEKSVGILRGEVSFTEAEFNALVLASLQSDPDGRKLLQVSDGVRAILHPNELELSAVINLKKLGDLEPKARDAVQKFDKLFWIIQDDRVAVSVFGQPVIRSGGLGLKDTFRAKVGEMDFSNDTLRSLKVPVEKANQTKLSIDYLTLKSVTVDSSNIHFGVRPKF